MPAFCSAFFEVQRRGVGMHLDDLLGGSQLELDIHPHFVAKAEGDSALHVVPKSGGRYLQLVFAELKLREGIQALRAGGGFHRVRSVDVGQRDLGVRNYGARRIEYSAVQQRGRGLGPGWARRQGQKHDGKGEKPAAGG
jgi:hypothetical protein